MSVFAWLLDEQTEQFGVGGPTARQAGEGHAVWIFYSLYLLDGRVSGPRGKSTQEPELPKRPNPRALRTASLVAGCRIRHTTDMRRPARSASWHT